MAPFPRGRAQLLTIISLLAAVWISSPLGPTLAAIPPTFSTFVSLDPDGGEVLRGGAPYTVRWNVTQENVTVLWTTLEASADGGANYTLLDEGNYSTGGATYDWPVPVIDTSRGRVRVCVDDGQGNASCRESAGDFTIDSTPPVILSTDPADGALNVPVTHPLGIAFSEDMDRSSVTLTLAPMVALQVTWSSSGDLVISPAAGWPSCTAVTILVNGQDLAGNPLAPGPVPNPWTFTTTCGFPYIVSTNPADGAVEVPPGGDVVIGFSEPMEPASVGWSLAPSVPLVPSWSAGSSVLTLSLKEVRERINVTGNPDYFDGSADWICRQRDPNAEWINVTANTAALHVEIWASNPAGDNDLAIFRDTNENGVCDTGIDTLLVSSASPGVSESATLGNPTPGHYLAQVGFWSPGAEVFSIRVTHARALSPCTSYTGAVLFGKDMGGKDLVSGAVPNPWSFTTNCASPLVVSTTPPHGEAGVSRDVPVVIAFTEGMDPNSVVVAFSPPVAGTSHAWDARYRELTVAHELLLPCTAYDIVVGARDPAGNALLPGAVPNPWSFVSSCAASASVRVLAPGEGNSWTGGSDHAVSYEIENQETFQRTFGVTATFRYAAGVERGTVGLANVTVAGGTVFRGEFPWRVPPVNAADVQVSVAIGEANLTLLVESPPFEIDSISPTVLSGTPSGSRIVLPVELLIGFSEPMAPPASDPLAVHPPVGRSVTWTSTDRITVALSGVQSCTGYDVAVGAPLMDDSDPGNPLIAFAWSFATTCAPTIDLVTPVGGEDGTGGSVHEIAWTSADLDDSSLSVTLSYTPDGGARWVVVEAGLVVEVGPASYSWTLPRIDASDVRARAEVTDPAGNRAADESPSFTIDTTPPSLLESIPREGSTGVETTIAVALMWSERVERASFEAAFSLVPSAGSLSFAWSTGEDGADVLTIAHGPFRPDTEYAVTFASTAKDDSDPGNHLSDLAVLTFRTRAPPPAIPPLALAAGLIRAQVGERVTFDASQSAGDLVDYEWRITDGEERLVAHLFGLRPSHVFENPGQYRVLLRVTDVRGAADTDAFEITITSSPLAWAVLGGAILFAAGMSSTEGGKFFVLKFLLVPLYARRRRNELLEHQTRGMILGHLMVHPGDTYSHLKRNLQLSNGTLSYHLVVLEREGILRAQTYGVHKRFFPVGVRVPEDGGGLHEVQMRMLGAIREVPGLAVKDIAGALGITSQHALYHIRGLAAKGLVRLERKGVRLRCFPDESPRSQLREP